MARGVSLVEGVLDAEKLPAGQAVHTLSVVGCAAAEKYVPLGQDELCGGHDTSRGVVTVDGVSLAEKVPSSHGAQ